MQNRVVHSGELETQIPEPLQLTLNSDNQIMMTLTWENGEQKQETIEEFLDLTPLEQKIVQENRQKGFLLVCDKRIQGAYPDYFKRFHDTYHKYFTGTREKTQERDVVENSQNAMFSDREYRELVFVKLNLPETVSEEIQAETLSFKKIFEKILENIWLMK